MKTLFTTDVAGATRFLEAVKFRKLQYCGENGIKGKICIQPTDEFELKQGTGNACLIASDGILGNLGIRLEKEFGAKHMEVTRTSEISGWCNYETPFGFTFHIHVVVA